MDEYFEEDDKDIEVLYDSTTAVVKKEELEESKDVKKELELELKKMTSMNLPTQFVYSNGRFEDVKLKEECTTFCSLCQVKMRNVKAYEAHMKGNKHCKKLIATGLQRR